MHHHNHRAIWKHTRVCKVDNNLPPSRPFFQCSSTYNVVQIVGQSGRKSWVLLGRGCQTSCIICLVGNKEFSVRWEMEVSPRRWQQQQTTMTTNDDIDNDNDDNERKWRKQQKATIQQKTTTKATIATINNDSSNYRQNWQSSIAVSTVTINSNNENDMFLWIAHERTIKLFTSIYYHYIFLVVWIKMHDMCKWSKEEVSCVRVNISWRRCP